MLSIPIRDYRFTEYFLDYLPIDYALQVIDFNQKQQTQQWNALSITSAFGWASLMSSFGGTKLDYRDLLPVQNEDEVSLKSGFSSPTKQTLSIIDNLLKQGRLPYRVKVALLGTGILKYLKN